MTGSRNGARDDGDSVGMVVVKCVALVVGLVLALGFVASTFLRDLPKTPAGVLGFVLGVLCLWAAVYGCRRIIRRARTTRPMS